MPWNPIEQSFPRHRKTLKAVRLLGTDRYKFMGHMVVLWGWALDNASESGEIGVLTGVDIAAAAEWKGSPDQFLDVLLEVGFLSRDPGEGLSFHNWDRYTGRYHDAKRANARRQAAYRQRRKPVKPGVSNAESDVTSNADSNADSNYHKGYCNGLQERREEKSNTLPPVTVPPAAPQGIDELPFFKPEGKTEWQDVMRRELAKDVESNPVAVLVEMAKRVSQGSLVDKPFDRAGRLVKTVLRGDYGYAVGLLWDHREDADGDLINYVVSVVAQANRPKPQPPPVGPLEPDFERIAAERAADRAERERSGT